MSNMTNYFDTNPTLNKIFQPYADAFKKGIHLENGKLIKVYAMPAENEMLVVLDKTTTAARQAFMCLACNISESCCIDFMPIIIDISRFKTSLLAPDAIELEVTDAYSQ